MGLGKLVLGAGSLFLLATVAPHCDRDVYVGTVIEKVSRVKDEDARYLVSAKIEGTGETRTFEVEDSLLEGRFSSSDRWAEIEEGKTYKFKTYGWRVPFFSWYENIIEHEEVPQNTSENAIGVIRG